MSKKKKTRWLEKYKVIEGGSLMVATLAIYFAYQSDKKSLEYQKSQNRTAFEITPISSNYEAFAKIKSGTIKGKEKFVLFFGSRETMAATFFFDIKNTGDKNARKVIIESVIGFEATIDTLEKLAKILPFARGQHYLGHIAPGSSVGQDYVMDFSNVVPKPDKDFNYGEIYQNWFRNGFLELKASFRISYTNEDGKQIKTLPTNYRYTQSGGHVLIIEENLFEEVKE